jgi:hypothetical protein
MNHNPHPAPSPQEQAVLLEWWFALYPLWQRSPEEKEADFQKFLVDKKINLYNCKLTHLPEAFGSLSRLEHLNLNYNPLQALPACMGVLRSLNMLEVFEAQFTRLPPSFTQLARLQSCALGAALTELPEDFGQLQALEFLDLKGNALTTLPASMRHLHKLQSLKLNRNQLTTVPDWVGELPALTYLDLRGNPLTHLPDCLGEMHQLRYLGYLGYLGVGPDVQQTLHVPDLARWRTMREGPLGEIQVTFAKHLGDLRHELPPEDAKDRRNGSVGPEEGDYGYFDTVHYRFGQDARGEFLDYHTEHRTWGARCARIREDGSSESSEPCFYCEN